MLNIYVNTLSSCKNKFIFKSSRLMLYESLHHDIYFAEQFNDFFFFHHVTKLP